jgi:hypothetical protein
MRILQSFLAAIMILTLLVGCEETLTETVVEEVSTLHPPLGLRSITGDGQVTLRWYAGNYEENFAGYLIYQATGDYQQLAPVEMPAGFAVVETLWASGDSPPTIHTILGLDNGTTYSFALTATNGAADEVSGPSNIVADTPRPFGTAIIYQQEAEPDNLSGFDFSEGIAVSYTDPACDIFLDVYNIYIAQDTIIHYSLTSPHLANSAQRMTEIQDMGYTDSFDDIDISPELGWDPDYSVDVLNMQGHTFALLTADSNYVKLRVLETSDPDDPGTEDQWVQFEYGHQDNTGDPNFKALP